MILDPAEAAVRVGGGRGALPLHDGILRHFAPVAGVRLLTRSDVPAGSGLGGSSALAVSLLGALFVREGRSPDPAVLAPLARDIEARVLEIPTGTQDHLAALHGGMSAIHHDPGAALREPLPIDVGAFESRSVLVFLGASRASSRANWDMVRRALDGEEATRRGLQAIAAIAVAMRDALSRGDLDETARLVHEEWKERRGLSPEVTTPGTDRALAAAREAGATGGKICGAGGGGCLFVMGPPGARERIIGALRDVGCAPIDFRIDTQGLLVERVEARDA